MITCCELLAKAHTAPVHRADKTVLSMGQAEHKVDEGRQGRAGQGRARERSRSGQKGQC